MNTKFSTLIGNKIATDILQNIIEKDNVAPAYLFTGISGIGKFKAASIFTQHLVGSSIETLIIQPDGTNAGVKIEQVREVSAWCATRPAIGNRKVVVINAENGLSEKSSNAILKTLEEPSSYVTIIIVSNYDMLQTINSRCHHVSFNKLTHNEVVKVLTNLGYHEVHEAVINASHGSPGKALQIIEGWDKLSPFIDDLSTLPETVHQALTHSNSISSKLDHQSQILLLELLTSVWWLKHDSDLLHKCTTAMKYLKSKVNARAIWDNLLIPS